MKIAVPILEKEKNEISDTFGRAPLFYIYDTITKTSNYSDNKQNLNAMQGAGIQSAQNLVSYNVDALITKNLGPKAYQVLNASNVKIYTTDETSIDVAIDKLINNELSEIKGANVEGHWKL